MPPEGYDKRRIDKIIDDFLENYQIGRSNYRRLTAKEQVEKIESDRLKKSLSKSMIDYVERYPN
jgi:hypothetical protein